MSPFGGDTYDPGRDRDRLNAQLRRVREIVSDGKFWTLSAIQEKAGDMFSKDDPTQSISARLRDFRKKRFGEHTVIARRVGDHAPGLWEYRFIPNGEGVTLGPGEEIVGSRSRKTSEEREALLREQLADLAVKRRAVLKKHMQAVAGGLDVIATTNLDVGPIRDECKGLAVRLRSWA